MNGFLYLLLILAVAFTQRHTRLTVKGKALYRCEFGELWEQLVYWPLEANRDARSPDHSGFSASSVARAYGTIAASVSRVCYCLTEHQSPQRRATTQAGGVTQDLDLDRESRAVSGLIFLRRSGDTCVTDKQLTARRYYLANREHLLKCAREYQRERRSRDPNYRMRGRIRTQLMKALFHGRRGTYTDDLGCDVSALRARIEMLFEPGMAWDNYAEVWELDHIRPLAEFDLTDRRQYLLAVNFTNIRPQYCEQNRARR